MKKVIAILVLFLLAPIAWAGCPTSSYSYSRSYSYTPSYSYATYERTVYTPFVFVNGYALASPVQSFIPIAGGVVAAPVVGAAATVGVQQQAAPAASQPAPQAQAQAGPSNAEIVTAFNKLADVVERMDKRLEKLEKPPMQRSPN